MHAHGSSYPKPVPAPSNSMSPPIASYSKPLPPRPRPSIALPVPPEAKTTTEPLKAESSEAEKAAKRLRIRNQVATEIMTTERSYVKSLQVMAKEYYIPLEAKAKDASYILSEKTMNNIFSNIRLIIDFNEKFLKELEAHMSNWSDETKIGKLFLSYAPFFKMYTQYVGNHDVATDELNKIMNKNKAFVNFQQERLAGKTVDGAPPESPILNLAAYLIMPIQRIPRYKLLLQELVRNTDEAHPDYADLTKALELVGQVATYINEAVRAQQNRLAVMNIQNQFGGAIDLVSPSRKFVRQGVLTKKCRSSDKKYEFILFNDLLLYGTKSGARYKLNRRIEINNMFVVQDLPKSDDKAVHGFQIVNSDKSFIVYADDMAVKQDWLRDLNACIIERQNTLQRDAGDFDTVQAPVWQSDDAATACQVCDKEFTFFNRRHHCRLCGALVCQACSTRRMVLKARAKSTPQRVCDKCVEKVSNRGSVASGPDDKAAAADTRSSSKDEGKSGAQDDDSDSDDEEDAPDSKANVAQDASLPSVQVSMLSMATGSGQQRTLCRALYPYAAREPTDLNFAEGDIIAVVEKNADGWWRGEFNDRTGYFPSNYVVELTEDGSDAAPATMEVDLRVVCVSAGPPATPGSTELTIKKGDRLHVSNKDSGGYYYGRNVETGVAGWFLAAHVVEESALPTVAAARTTAAPGAASGASTAKAKAPASTKPSSAPSSSSAAARPGTVRQSSTAAIASKFGGTLKRGAVLPVSTSSSASPAPSSSAANPAASKPAAAPAKAAVLSHNKPLPTRGATSSGGACTDCSCSKFSPSPFKPTMCKECQHSRANHA